MPNIGNTINGDDAFIKVVAVDTTGKESFDEAEIIIPTNDIAGNVQFNVTPGQTFGPGEMLASVYTTTGIDPFAAEVEYYFEDVRGETRKLTGRGRGGLPFLSTDTMRFVVAFGTTTNNRKYWYSPFFKMRPDSHLNDAPPTVSLTFPQAGNSFAPGGVIPITWTASDDEGLRGFDIIASYQRGADVATDCAKSPRHGAQFRLANSARHRVQRCASDGHRERLAFSNFIRRIGQDFCN